MSLSWIVDRSVVHVTVLFYDYGTGSQYRITDIGGLQYDGRSVITVKLAYWWHG